jgi:hypothetical protein
MILTWKNILQAVVYPVLVYKEVMLLFLTHHHRHLVYKLIVNNRFAQNFDLGP